MSNYVIISSSDNDNDSDSDKNDSDKDLDLMIQSSTNINNQFKELKNNFGTTNMQVDKDDNDDEEKKEQDEMDHELKVIYKLRILLNECEKLSKKTNNLKLKTNKDSSIYQSQTELIESINNNKISNQKLKEESQGIDSTTSILYLNKLNDEQ